MKKIKSISTYLRVNEMEEGKLQSLEQRDEQENVLLEELYYPTGDMESRIERVYNEAGRLELVREYATDREKPDQQTEFEYTAAGRIALKRVIYQDGSLSVHQYEYDEANLAENITIVDEDQEVEGREYRRFDSEGKILEERIELEDGSIEEQRKVEFDDHGMMLKRELTRYDEEKLELFVYERDEKGLVKKRYIEDEEGEIQRLDVFEYDERGNTLEHQAEDHNQGWGVIDRWEYDDQDRVIKSQRSYPSGMMLQETSMVYNEEGFLSKRETRTPQGVQSFNYRYEFFS